MLSGLAGNRVLEMNKPGDWGVDRARDDLVGCRLGVGQVGGRYPGCG